VAQVALAHGVNANLVHGSRRLERERRQAATDAVMVGSAAAAPMVKAMPFVPVTLAPSTSEATIAIKLRRGPLTMKATWPLSAATQCATWAPEKAYIWGYARSEFDGLRGVVYDFCVGRGAKYPVAFLDDWNGTIVCDDYKGYEPVFKLGTRIEAGCLVHARRKFEELLKNGHESPVAEEAIRHMAWIFWIEKQARAASAPERLVIRQDQTREHWDKLHEWLRSERARVPDGSGIAGAIDYSLNRWTPFGRFLEDGNVSCHNNYLENLMQPWEMNRKAWLFAGSELAGKRAATVMSLVQSVRLYGHDPWVYLKDVLTRLPTHMQRDIDELLPHRWVPLVAR
jgi:transposase